MSGILADCDADGRDLCDTCCECLPSAGVVRGVSDIVAAGGRVFLHPLGALIASHPEAHYCCAVRRMTKKGRGGIEILIPVWRLRDASCRFPPLLRTTKRRHRAIHSVGQ